MNLSEHLENAHAAINMKTVVGKPGTTMPIYPKDKERTPIVKKKGESIYIPQLIFGELLTSTNYDKDEKKVVGGKNGYGAKLTNIFSTSFELETVDFLRGKKYIQKFSNSKT